MATKKFKKETLLKILELKGMTPHDDDEYVIREIEMIDTSRWSIHYSMVFTERSTNKSYMTSYSVGATEYQDERPFEYDDDEIACTEVYPREVTVTEWTAV